MEISLPALQVLGYDEVRKSRSIAECSSKMEYPMLPFKGNHQVSGEK